MSKFKPEKVCRFLFEVISLPNWRCENGLQRLSERIDGAHLLFGQNRVSAAGKSADGYRLNTVAALERPAASEEAKEVSGERIS